MIKIIFSFLALLSITSCASFQMNLLNPKQTISPQLPYIEAQFDVTSIESAYTLGSTTGGASTIGAANWNFNKNRAFGLGTSFTALNTTSFRDKRVQDAITIFKREVENNICDNAIDNKKGIAVWVLGLRPPQKAAVSFASCAPRQKSNAFYSPARPDFLFFVDLARTRIVERVNTADNATL